MPGECRGASASGRRESSPGIAGQTATTSPAFDFLKDAAEDIYTAADGKPFDDQG